MKGRPEVRSLGQLVTSLALISVCMFSAPAVIGVVGEARASSNSPVSLGLVAAQSGVKIASEAAPGIDISESQPKKIAPVPVAASPAQDSPAQAYTSRKTVRAVRQSASSGSELSRARAILASLISRYPILKGTTVSFGKTPGGYQAVAYFKSGRILISTTHTASLDRILRHEVWHIIDWRDNGRIDWGENVPPK